MAEENLQQKEINKQLFEISQDYLKPDPNSYI